MVLPGYVISMLQPVKSVVISVVFLAPFVVTCLPHGEMIGAPGTWSG